MSVNLVTCQNKKWKKIQRNDEFISFKRFLMNRFLFENAIN